MDEDGPQNLAKITWINPETNEKKIHVLVEGATASIGRSPSSDIHIPDKHVSRQHAVISYRDGVFMITDLDSVNGTFINDQQIAEPFPLFSDDTIRLFVPLIIFEAAGDDDLRQAEEDGTLITATGIGTGRGRLIITSGPQEEQIIPLLLDKLEIGRATIKATWEIGLQDPAVSRPHAVMDCEDDIWTLRDLKSSNGTFVNNKRLEPDDRIKLKDGDLITFGKTLVLYRAE